jgi:O-antigen ligase
MISRRPLIGAGTGGFEAAYTEQVKGTGTLPSKNPHNQYLLITGQLGVIGLVAFVGLLVVAWRGANRLPTVLEQDMARGLVLAMASGCLFNSLLLDHTEGMLFCWLLAVLYGGYPRQTSRGALQPVGERAP